MYYIAKITSSLHVFHLHGVCIFFQYKDLIYHHICHNIYVYKNLIYHHAATFLDFFSALVRSGRCHLRENPPTLPTTKNIITLLVKQVSDVTRVGKQVSDVTQGGKQVDYFTQLGKQVDYFTQLDKKVN